MKRCVIIGASPEAYWDGRWKPDLVICADGGVNAPLGLTPDVVIGDGDSGLDFNSAGLPVKKTIKLPPEKNMTDMEACLDYALSAGMEEIALLGATGGRLDHFMGNIGLLERCKGAFLLDRAHEIRILEDDYMVEPPHRFGYFSVIPLDETIYGVSIKNAKYPLCNATLKRAETLGVSNEPVAGEKFYVSVKKGKALLIFCVK